MCEQVSVVKMRSECRVLWTAQTWLETTASDINFRFRWSLTLHSSTNEWIRMYLPLPVVRILLLGVAKMVGACAW